MPEIPTVVKKVKNGCLFSDGSMRLENVRASYPHVAEAQEQTDDNGVKTLTFGLQVLMPKDTHREAKDLCKAAIDEMVAQKQRSDKKFKGLPAERKFIKDGDALAKDETEGQWVVNAREKNRPVLRGRKRDPSTGRPIRITPEEGKEVFYGGCYVTVLVKPWFQDNKYGKRANCSLLAVQFVKDGERFGEGRISEDQIDGSLEADDVDDSGGWDDDDDL